MWFVGVLASIAIGITAHLGPIYFTGAILAGIWMLFQSFDFIKNPTPQRGGSLFLQGSRYRGIMFGSLIVDVLLLVLSKTYVSIIW
jgi:4-hydroxybenzoate polyprenyltransferase